MNKMIFSLVLLLAFASFTKAAAEDAQAPKDPQKRCMNQDVDLSACVTDALAKYQDSSTPKSTFARGYCAEKISILNECWGDDGAHANNVVISTVQFAQIPRQ